MLALAALLRKETHSVHKQVEGSAFMAALLSGRLEKSAYVLLLRNLEPIYESLEHGLLCHADTPGISPIVMKSLFRLASLHRDLEFLHGPSWRGDFPLVATASRYVTHLGSIQGSTSARLAAHAYVRYLGDLSGGQMLRKIVADSLNLPNYSKGVSFYHFGEPHQVVELVMAFRTGLDLIGGTTNEPTDIHALLAEAQFAFQLHVSLFDELAIVCGLSNADSGPTQSVLSAEGSNTAIERSGALG